MMIFTLFLLFFSQLITPSFTENSSAVLKPKYTSKASVIDISGHWEGTITRDEGAGKRTVYQMEMEVTQRDKAIMGTSIVHYDGGTRQYHAKMEFKGKLTGTYFKYLETRVVNSDSIPNTEWCVKKADLIHRIQDTRPTLEGIWEGVTSMGDCMPGRIFLQKKPPRV